MRIAIIKSNYSPYGGAEKYAYYLVNAFAKKGYTVDILTAEKKQWVEGKGINFIPINMASFNNFLKLYTFNKGTTKYLKRHFSNYSCILDMDRTMLQTHIRAGGGCHKAWLERRKKISPIYKTASFYLNPFHRYMLMIEKESLKNPYLRKLICISNMVKNDFLKYYDIDERKVCVVHNGVEWEELEGPFTESLDQKNIILQGLGLKKDNFYFLFVGSGYERKGVANIIKAMKMLPKDCNLLVIGKDRNIDKYTRLANKEGVLERIQFFGPRSKTDVIRFLQAADSFVFPSFYEPFGSAALEALAMGLFTIASASTGCSEIIKEDCGIIVENPYDVDKLAASMKQAIRIYDRNKIRESVKEYSFKKKLDELIKICVDT